MVVVKGGRAVLEIEFALDQEGMEFLPIRAIKCIRLMDSSLSGGSNGISYLGESLNGMQNSCFRVLRQHIWCGWRAL